MDESLVRNFHLLRDDLAAQIAPRAGGRYALFGHSMGALLAYGCAHALVRSGAPEPVALAVAAAASTRPPRRETKTRSDEDLIHDLRRNGAPEALFEDAETLRITLGVLAADYEICDSFTPEPGSKLSAPFLIYGGAADTLSEADLSGWQRESMAPSKIVMFDGGHFFIRGREEKTFLRQLAEDLRALL